MTDIVDRLRGPSPSIPAMRDAADEIERLRHALARIRDHQCTAYDHPLCDSEMYRGPYGIGIVDGHRAAALIASSAFPRKTT